MNDRATFLCDTSGQVLTVYIRGEIDHHTAVAVRNGIDTRLFELRPTKLILDLSAVGFMDSSGLGLIMGRLSVMKSLGGEMILRDPGRETESILTLAGMERLIPIEHTPDPYTAETAETAEDVNRRPYVCPQMSVESSKNKHTGQAGRGKATARRQRRAKSPITSA